MLSITAFTHFSANRTGKPGWNGLPRLTKSTIRESAVAESLTPAVDKTLDTMISLTRLGPLQRVLVAGDDSRELYLALRRRGFLRATTPAL
jgi:hypothetical protein